MLSDIVVPVHGHVSVLLGQRHVRHRADERPLRQALENTDSGSANGRVDKADGDQLEILVLRVILLYR